MSHSTNNDSRTAPMGLSIVSVLQQNLFLSNLQSSYIMRRVANSLIIFKASVKSPKRHDLTAAQLVALHSTKLTGALSRQSQKNIVQIIQNWDDTLNEINYRNKLRNSNSTHQLVMLTLTLSSKQTHSDQFIKRHLLAAFIQKLMRYNPRLSYLWKAEPQLNGNIHFHLLIDQYFRKEFIQREWNITQSAHGYHSYLSNDKADIGKPSTRIEALRNVSNASAYAAKYISKNEGERAIEGRLWGCSDKLKTLKPIEYNISREEVETIVTTTVTNLSQLNANKYCCVIKFPHDWNLIRESLVQNYASDLAINMNIQRYFSYSINPKFDIESTEWYRAICREIGQVNTSYIANNGCLFNED